MKEKYRVQEYIDGVKSGEITTCKYTRFAIRRHIRDLKKSRSKKVYYPYYFEEKEPIRVIEFIHEYCYHVKGEFGNERRKVILEPWEQFIIWVLFGWRKKDDKKRRFNTAFVFVAKKNGKSTFIACIGLYLFIADGESGAEIYSAATTRDQAKIIFYDYARAMVLKNPELAKVINIYKHSMTYDPLMSVFRPVSSDADTLDGLNVQCALIDEYHAHKDDGVYNILAYGMAARKQPLMLIISTAGFDPNVPCVAEEEYAKNVLSGTYENDNYFAIIYEIDHGDDWKDKTKWIKANPNLGISKEIDAMERDFKKAIDKPEEQNKFKNKHLNIWTSNKYAWILDEKWRACITDIKPPDQSLCYAGVDLSSSIDLTAVALCFLPANDGDQYVLKFFFYLPDADMTERVARDKVPYDVWAQQGYLTLTPGNVVDYDFIQSDLIDISKKYNLQKIAYDPHNASQWVTNMNAEGFEEQMIVFPQTPAYLSPAAKDFEVKILSKKLGYIYNPVIDWMISCTDIKSDANGNIRPIKPDRQKSGKRIDGVVAAIMALDLAIRNEDEGSIYESRGIRTLGGDD